jgi:hypothetical protein
MRREERAHVELARPVGSERPDFLRFERAEQLRLHGRAHFRHFVEEQRSTVGFDEEALSLLVGSGEGAPCVAEKLGFKERIRQGGAVDGDKGLVASRAALVNRASDALLAGARLAADHDRDHAWGEAPQDGEELEHLGGSADEAAEALVSIDEDVFRRFRDEAKALGPATKAAGTGQKPFVQ